MVECSEEIVVLDVPLKEGFPAWTSDHVTDGKGPNAKQNHVEVEAMVENVVEFAWIFRVGGGFCGKPLNHMVYIVVE